MSAFFDKLYFVPASPEAADEELASLRASPQLPADFCWRGYITANGDMWHFTTEAMALRHYVQYGFVERRVYRRRFDAEFFRKLYYGARDQRPAAELHRVWQADGERKYANLRELLWHNGFAQGAWPNQFDVQSYIVYNNLQAIIGNDIQAIAHFLTTGVHALLAISSDLQFDPKFRRALFGDPPDRSDAALYREWIENGLPRNESVNEQHFLRNLNVALPEIPGGFLWRDYISERPHLAHLAPTKWHAFEHFAQHGVLERGSLPLTREAAGPVLLALADRFVLVGRMDDADRLYERIFLSDEPLPAAWQHAGDNAFRAGQHARALNLYGRVEKAGAANFWTYCNFIEAATIVGDTDMAASWAERALGLFPRNQRLLDLHREIHRQKLDSAIQRHIARLRLPHDSIAEANRPVKQDIEAIYLALVAKYEIQFGKPPAEPAITATGRKLRVVMLANQDLPQCTYYRVTQKYEQLTLAGTCIEIFAREQVADFRSALACADIAIFYRLAANLDILDCIALCACLGVPSVYEIDDLVFDPAHFPEALEAYEGAIGEAQHFELAAGVALVESVAGLCRYGITSTQHLAAHLAQRVRSGQVAVHRNGLSAELASIAQSGIAPVSRDGRIRIFYGSGTKAHGADFRDLLAPALARLLGEYENLVFVACGHVDCADLRERFPGQVEVLPLLADRRAYLWQLRGIDINTAVLRQSDFNDCKSEIKWLEAAIFGIPSVASEVGGFRETLAAGEIVLAGSSFESWYFALKSLIADPALRQAIGENARARALAAYAPAQLGSALGNALREIAGRGSAAKAEPRKRILLVNVFYPPQSIGGATRVVHDEALTLAASGEFEVAVLCGNDQHAPSYALNAYWYEGVRVFSINTAAREFMDWWPEDAAVRPSVERVLAYFQPDLVHFHATQRLTVTAADAVREMKIPYIVTVHDAWWISDHQFLMNGHDYLSFPWQEDEFESGANPHSREASAARRFTLMAALADAARVLAVSDSFAQLYRRAGVAAASVLQNAVSNLPPLENTPVPEGKVRLGHIGGMTYHKGFFILKQALMRGAYDRIELVAVDHAASRNTVRHERWGASEVRIIGKVAQDRTGWLYGQFDVLAALSTWPESFGLVTREALAYGKWIIASDRGAIGEVVIEGVNGHRVSVEDREGIETVLAAIQANPARYTTPPPKAQESFSVQDHAAQLAAIYRGVLGADQR